MSQKKKPTPAARTLVVGDVHGCYTELMDLLDKAAVGSGDRVVFVGDLINRGPDNRQVLDFVQSSPQSRSVMGNHEYNLLRYYRGETRELKNSYQRLIQELGRDFGYYMDFVAQFPYALELDEALVIHAGVRPGLPLSEQDPEDLVNLRALGPEGIPWYEFYTGQKPIIFGHWVRLEPLVLKNAIGLDTGCVYGGQLSGVWLPDFEIVSVPARDIYVYKPDKAYLYKG